MAAPQLVLLSIACFIRLSSVDGRHCESFFVLLLFGKCVQFCALFLCLVLLCFVLFCFASFCFVGRLMAHGSSAWLRGGILPLKCSYCKLACTSVGSVAVAVFEFSTFLSIMFNILFYFFLIPTCFFLLLCMLASYFCSRVSYFSYFSLFSQLSFFYFPIII